MNDLDLSVVYEGEMDKEILALCDALNCIPGIRTTDSCIGHGKSEPRVFLRCSSIGSLNILCMATYPYVSVGIICDWSLQINNIGINEDTLDIRLVLVGKLGIGQVECDMLADVIRGYLKVNH